MTKFLLTLAAGAALASPALADPAQKIAFERDGIHYVAKVYNRDGAQHIIGHEVETGRNFALTVIKGQVSGVYDASQVEYSVPTASLPLQTASR